MPRGTATRPFLAPDERIGGENVRQMRNEDRDARGEGLGVSRTFRRQSNPPRTSGCLAGSWSAVTGHDDSRTGYLTIRRREMPSAPETSFRPVIVHVDGLPGVMLDVEEEIDDV